MTLLISFQIYFLVPSNPKYDGIPSISWINTSDVTPKLSINFAGLYNTTFIEQDRGNKHFMLGEPLKLKKWSL